MEWVEMVQNGSNSLDWRLKALVRPRNRNNSPLLSPTLGFFPRFKNQNIFELIKEIRIWNLSHRPKELSESAGKSLLLCRLVGPEQCVPAFSQGFIFVAVRGAGNCYEAYSAGARHETYCLDDSRKARIFSSSVIWFTVLLRASFSL